MLSKKDHIIYWLKTGNDIWDAAVYLMQGGKNVEALFIFCLAVEKWLKANWVLDNIDNQTDLQLDPMLIDFLDTINRWNMEDRYPDYRFSLHKLATGPYLDEQYLKLQKLRLCLLERL